jgi:hypothetical protein
MMASPAMLTPFAQPEICSDLTTTSLLSFYNSTASVPPVTVVIPNEADPRYASCNPPGWNPELPEPSRFVFSPAVCPSQWTAYEIGEVGGTSAANCCPRYVLPGPVLRMCASSMRPVADLTSGFTLQQTRVTRYELAGFDDVPGYADTTICEKTQTSVTSVWVLATTTSTLSTPSTTTPLTLPQLTSPPPPSSVLRESTKTIYQFHRPYSIQWQESDRTNLSPQPPTVGCPNWPDLGMKSTWWPHLASWDPKLPAPTTSCYNNWGDPDSSYKEPTKPLIEGRYVPMVITFSIVGAIFLAVIAACVFSSRKKKRLAREQARAGVMSHEVAFVGPKVG